MTAKIIDVDVRKLNWPDLEQIEDWAGHPIANEMAGAPMSIRTVKALLCWRLRQDDPTVNMQTLPPIGAVELNAIGMEPGAGPLGSASTPTPAA